MDWISRFGPRNTGRYCCTSFANYIAGGTTYSINMRIKLSSESWHSSNGRRAFGVCFLVLTLTLPACEGFLDVGVPKSQLVSATAFENESTARSALLAIYS